MDSELDFEWSPIRLIVAAILGLVYLASPIDIVPDVIPLAGWIDDFMVATAVIRLARADIHRWRRWKHQRWADGGFSRSGLRCGNSRRLKDGDIRTAGRRVGFAGRRHQDIRAAYLAARRHQDSGALGGGIAAALS